MKPRLETAALLLLFVLTAVVFRLPHLTSGQVALDGDEAIVGLMARDLIDGQGVPLFFYGQRYGLALPEVLALAGAFELFGDSPIVVKATMLGLWILGGIFVVRAAVRIGGGTAGALVGILLASMPTWVPWSMKARGGYLTAFCASAIALWILSGFLERRLHATRTVAAEGPDGMGAPEQIGLQTPLGAEPSPAWRAPVRGFLLGLVLVVALLAQPLFLIPLLPFFLYVRPFSAWIGCLVGGAALAAPLLARIGTGDVAWSPQLFGPFDPGGMVEIPFRLTTALGGYFFYLVPGEPPDIVVWAGRVLAAVGFLGIVYALVTRVRDHTTDALWASAVGVLTFFFVVLWIRPEQFAYRYLLPLGVPLAILVGLIATRLIEGVWGRGFVYVASAVLFGLSAASAFAGRTASLAVAPGDERGSETEATEALVEHLEERGIANVYVLDPMYQWNLIFAGGGEIHARWKNPVDRVPEISRAVDAAYAAGQPVAVVGDARFAPRLREALDESGWNRLRMDLIQNRHFVLERPPRTLLDALDFHFEAEGP